MTLKMIKTENKPSTNKATPEQVALVRTTLERYIDTLSSREIVDLMVAFHATSD
jgi:response regulator of citrate/malate metabolism